MDEQNRSDGVIGSPHTESDDMEVAGVVLAAGTSSRYGAENKLLADIDGITLVKRSVGTIVKSVVEPTIVITGNDAARIERELEPTPVETVRNSAYDEGQSTSVAAGVRALPTAVDAAVFALGDMPFVRPASVDTLVRAYCNGRETGLAAAYRGCRGNPVLFDSVHFESLGNVSGDRGGRDVFLDAKGSSLVETGDPGVLYDIDTPDDVEPPDMLTTADSIGGE